MAKLVKHDFPLHNLHHLLESRVIYRHLALSKLYEMPKGYIILVTCIKIKRSSTALKNAA